MLRAAICKGDPTSHGGQVLEGNELMTTNGRAVAQLGHMTICPLCKGKFPIIEGLDFHSHLGRGTAVGGMQTACGAKLIATQQQMLIDDGGGDSGGGGGGGGGGESPSPPATGAAQPAADEAVQYGGSFRAVDDKTGQPVAGLPYRIELSDGRTVRGVTDQDGHTQRITSHDQATARLYWEAQAGDD